MILKNRVDNVSCALIERGDLLNKIHVETEDLENES